MSWPRLAEAFAGAGAVTALFLFDGAPLWPAVVALFLIAGLVAWAGREGGE